MAGRSNLHPIEEGEQFEPAVRHICTFLKVDRGAFDRVMAGVRWVIARDPDKPPLASGSKTRHFVFTNRTHCPEGDVPMLRVTYRIVSGGVVILVFVETVDVFL